MMTTSQPGRSYEIYLEVYVNIKNIGNDHTLIASLDGAHKNTRIKAAEDSNNIISMPM